MATAEQLRPYQFKKGQSGNPSGKTRIPDHLRYIKSLTAEELCKIISKYARMAYKDLIGELENDDAPMIERIIAKIFKQSLQNGDYNSLNFLLDRAVGKTPIIMAEEDDSERAKLSKLSFQELLAVVKNALPDIKIPVIPTDIEIIETALGE